MEGEREKRAKRKVRQADRDRLLSGNRCPHCGRRCGSRTGLHSHLRTPRQDTDLGGQCYSDNEGSPNSWEQKLSVKNEIVCVFLATQLLFHREALSCQAWEYRSSSGECCPKCASGSRVAKPCTSSSSTRCVPCSEGTYTDHPNGLAECFQCLPCDPGAHLKVKEECTYTKNTVCTCVPGYFCSHPMNEKPCEICTQHTVSPPGYMVIQEGTETNDTKFVRCPLGTFSEMEMSSSCEPWKDCSKEGLVEVRSGSASLDAVCGRPKPGKRSRAPLYPLLIAGFLLLVASPLGMIYRRGQQSTKKGAAEEEKEEREGDYIPVQERNVMVIPMQETSPNHGEPSYRTFPSVDQALG
ncbi:tumor necrosis factor receptor superfamily member 14 isoform X2 [Anolis sagrei]|uniref:tumor necrosis factor receptor superfamily member 14 isoform X2 n=1 Tax=Anolis sagrei TaxID=38937 RepID=UPI00351FB22B